MTNQQIYEDIEKLIEEIDNIPLSEIKNKLLYLLPDPCEYCRVRCDRINKFGRDINPGSAGGTAGSYVYTLCSHCNKCVGWSM